MDSMLVPGKCHFYISTGENAPPFPLVEGANPATFSSQGWANLGHTSRRSLFSLVKDNPSSEEQSVLYEDPPSFGAVPDYWKFEIPLIGLTLSALKMVLPGSVESDAGLIVTGGSPVARSVLAVFEDNKRLFGLYFQRVKLRAETGFTLNINEQTVVPVTGFVAKPGDGSHGKFMIIESSNGEV